MAAAAVSAGSAGSCSSSRIWEFCAVSIRLIRAWSRAAWAIPLGGGVSVSGGELGSEQGGAAGSPTFVIPNDRGHQCVSGLVSPVVCSLV